MRGVMNFAGDTHIVNVCIVDQIPVVLIIDIRDVARLHQLSKPKCMYSVVHGIDSHQSLVIVSELKGDFRVYLAYLRGEMHLSSQ